MNADICKLLYPNRIYCFSERQLYTQKNYLLLSGCPSHVVLGTKKTLGAKYSVIVPQLSKCLKFEAVRGGLN